MTRYAEALGLTPAELQPWLVLSGAVIALGLVVVILARLRWIQSRPLAACVVLSVVAHALILFGMVCMRLFDFPNAPGNASIVVHFTEETQVDSSQLVAAISAPETVAENTELPALPVETLPHAAADPAEMLSALDLPASEAPRPPDWNPTAEPQVEIADPAPVVRDLETETPRAEPALEVAVTESTPRDAEGSWKPAVESPPLAANSPKSAPPTSEPTPATSIPEAFPFREQGARQEMLVRFGGNEQTEQAVQDALQWLATHQSTHGGWNASQYGAGRGGVVDGQERGDCGIRADTGVTGLALLAFLAAGTTQRSGVHQSHVARALVYLLGQQDSSGSLAGSADHFAAMYCHGIATLAVSEAYTMTRDERLVAPLQRALSYSVAAQHPVMGGWRYRPGDDGDMSQFGWQFLAIHSGHEAGFGIPSATFDRLDRYLERVSRGKHGGLACYRPERSATPTMTAEALVCRLLQGRASEKTIEEATRMILDNPPGRGMPNFYYNYYGALALHLSGGSWNEWNRAMQQELITLQVHEGDMAGSWNTNSVWGGCGGRVFTTAMAALCMEVYYRYLPLVNREIARH